jgi:hypothetical protein
MLSEAKHLAFSTGCEVEILRLSPQNDMMAPSLDEGGNRWELERLELVEQSEPTHI